MSSSRSAKNKEAAFLPKDAKIPKPPKQPEKPLFPYMRYSRRVWDTVKNANPEMKMWDIGKRVGEQWRALSEDERQGYFDEYEVEKIEFTETMKVYHNSQAYRDWIKAKEKAQNEIQEKQLAEKTSGSAIPKEEPRFQLQQMDDEDEDDGFSAKHFATARFQRNHRLIGEIFGESPVPDIKTIVTKPRLENLKRQVQSLMQHQRKLESEIVDMEERFSAKKRRILEQSDRFTEEITKLSKPRTPASSPLKDATQNTTSSQDSTVAPVDIDEELPAEGTESEVAMDVEEKAAVNAEEEERVAETAAAEEMPVETNTELASEQGQEGEQISGESNPPADDVIASDASVVISLPRAADSEEQVASTSGDGGDGAD